MKKTNSQKGITLVALIITIIVLLILAVVAIGAVQNDGIINYAKNARNEYDKKADEEKQKLEDYLVHVEEVANNYTIHNGIIPEGGQYVTADGTTYGPGDNFPKIAALDTYTYGDYVYSQIGCETLDEAKELYKLFIEIDEGMSFEEFLSSNNMKEEDFWKTLETDLNSIVVGYQWKVEVQDKTKTQYGEILGKINGCLVTNMEDTFALCESLVTAPIIPSSVTNMASTFSDCGSLVTVPAIPSSVTNMRYTFNTCESLVTAPAIPSSVTDMEGTFSSCRSLVTVPAIPSSVTNMRYTFQRCDKLKGNIEVNANPTEYSECFLNTKHEITITGSASDATKAALAGTANNGNVKY